MLIWGCLWPGGGGRFPAEGPQAAPQPRAGSLPASAALLAPSSSGCPGSPAVTPRDGHGSLVRGGVALAGKIRDGFARK